MDEQNTVTQQQEQNPQPVNEQTTVATENETAVVQTPTPSETNADNQSTSSTISFIAAVICGAILAIIFLRWKKRRQLRVVTFEEVCQYGRNIKKQYPEAVSTMVSVVVNEKTNVTTLIQVALNKEGMTIEQGKEDVVGRQFEILDVDSKLKELMGDDIKCVIPIE